MSSASPPETPTTPKILSFEAPVPTSSAFAISSQPRAPQARSTSTSTSSRSSTSSTSSINSSSTSTLVDNNSSDGAGGTPFTRSLPDLRHHSNSHSSTLQTRRTNHLRHLRFAPYAHLSSRQLRVHHHDHRPQFAHLLQPLHPLVSVETGLPHPLFPRTLLAYHLLSHAQLDSLAAHYHQLHPSYHSLGYPTAVVGRWWAQDDNGGDEASMNGARMQRDQHFEALMMEAKGVLGVVERFEEGGELEVCEAGEEGMREGKRRRFGRFIGMKGCESPGREDEAAMSAVMEAWVDGEVRRRMNEDSEREGWREKGAW